LDSDRDGYTNGEELGDPEGLWKIGDPDPVGVFYDPGDDQKNAGQVCGDGRVTPPERCDGANFDRRTCVTLGLDDGILRWSDTCELDTSGCGATGEDMEVVEDMGPSDPDMDSSLSEGEAANEGGCTTTPGAPGVFVLLLAFGGFFRRRR
jgi:MYXO-CTERM domain-containing protein